MAGNLECDPATLTGTQQIFCKLLKKHSLYKLYNDMSPQLDAIWTGAAADYKKIGLIATDFLLSVVNYKAPNVNTGLSTK